MPRVLAEFAAFSAGPGGAIRIHVFGELTRERFLQDHWQRAPLWMPGALPGFCSPLSSDELAGLACEPDVESRLVQGRVGSSWRLEHGPFRPSRFRRLPARDWTLLVQDVDKFVPSVAALLEPFRFIPEWRIDDIMISVAAPGGSVGPHTDEYDVFLLQAHGRRRWQLAETFDPTLEAGADLKILQNFRPERELVAEPGDILYLPPNVAHFGVAEDEAITFSIGFRAPDQRELLAGFASELTSRAAPSRRFSDPGRAPCESPAALDPDDLAALRELLRQGLSRSDAELDAFLGRYLTQGKPNLEVQGEPAEPETVKRRLTAGDRLVRRLGARFAYLERDAQLWVYADGVEHRLAASEKSWAEQLFRGAPFDERALSAHPGALPWITSWLGQAALAWEGDDDA